MYLFFNLNFGGWKKSINTIKYICAFFKNDLEIISY
jgi:hypothetical protein